jgi:PII-like signaling protein
MSKRKMMLIFCDENDTFGDLPLYEAIIRKLAQLGVAGATATAGIKATAGSKRYTTSDCSESPTTGRSRLRQSMRSSASGRRCRRSG